jgi:peroxiredoxin/mono/diheme cytochrome c family protein
MRWLFILASLAWLGVAPAFGQNSNEPSNAKFGNKISNFTLKSADGKATSLYDLKDKKAIVLVFLSFDCPVSTGYSPTLIELAKDYGPRGVAFLGISPTDDDAATVAKHAKEFSLPFPVLKDEKLVAADALKAEITPEAFILDGQFYQLRYRGRIDNGYAARLKKNAQTTKFDLKQALDELLAGKDISTPVTEAVGCSIVRETKSKPSTGSVTYYRDVAPILQKNCQSCHRPGEVGPFALMTYKQAVNWASDIKEYTQKREMPPWKPVEGPAFRDDRKMTDKEIATLAAWVDGSTPAGDPKDAPPPAKFTNGWQLGQPDLVLSADSDFNLGASGRDVFRCFVFPTNLTEDKYITAIEVRPGNPRVVHHTLNFIDTGGRGRKLEQQEKERPKKEGEKDTGPGYSMAMGIGFLPNGAIGGWAPGQLARHLPDNTGYFLPKGSDVILQVHYHRDGREEKDRTQIGLYFAKQPVAKRFQGMVLPGRFLFLPAGADDFKVKGTITVDQDCVIHSIMPHMHMLGKQIRVTMTPPGGDTTPLINIKEWEYNWQETYFFKEPIAVKAGTRFDVEARYDNSAKNPRNPNNPPKLVHFGEQTTDEMCFVFFGATADRPGRIRVKFSLQ